jgi:transketolase
MTGETKVKEMDRENLSYYEELARKVRLDIIKAVFHAGSGHPGGSLSCADILTALP